MNFHLSPDLDQNKVFLVSKSDVTRRWDPFYSIPSIVELENKVRQVTPHRLRDFVVSMAGGATPLTSESNQHYTDSNDGIPFIRVQNLSTTGNLNLEDVKHITRKTHETLLARSRLSGGELLVKITGVGRMAIASVVPEGFEANINQHIVAIRTNDIQTSQTLAAYLNLDIAEKLASRRSTGGTRPALDYPALLSIPVVLNEKIYFFINEAVNTFNQEINHSQELLESIDLVLLQSLGVITRNRKNQNQMFFYSFAQVSGQRLDPLYYNGELLDFVKTSKFQFVELKKCISYFLTGFAAGRNEQAEEDGGIIQIRPTNINEARNLIFNKNVYISSSQVKDHKFDLLMPQEVLFNNTNSQELVGKSAFFDLPGAFFCSNHITRIGVNAELLNPKYLYYLLNLYQRNRMFYRVCTNWNNQSGVGVDILQKLLIPLPDLQTQVEIVTRLDRLCSEAESVRKNAYANLVKAKKQIEKQIIGDDE